MPLPPAQTQISTSIYLWLQQHNGFTRETPVSSMAARQAQTILITGANRGLGLEMVKQLVESRTCRVFAACRDPNAEKSKALQELANKHPKAITVVQMDTTDLGSVKEAARQIGEHLQGAGLNLLVNNAGIGQNNTVETCSDETMLAIFSTNVMGTLRVTKEFVPFLRTAAKASDLPGMSCSKAAVINITSVLASVGLAAERYGMFPAFEYSISKAGLNMLNQCAMVEYKNDEIMFVLLHPGWVRTEMGGPSADIDASESVQGMMKVMDSLTEEHNGTFYDYTGKTLPW